jgi:hypothetical protein
MMRLKPIRATLKGGSMSARKAGNVPMSALSDVRASNAVHYWRKPQFLQPLTVFPV